VDQGKIPFDDPEPIYKYLPEFQDLQILEGYTDEGKEILKKPKNKITLKMMLNHTCGE
jgi:methyl acetate hydrolase